MQPLISVIIPVYNVEKYLARCLDSVIGQTYKNLELICVNDGSTDNSLAILQDYAAIDARIKIINRKNGGLSAARNSGMACATGEFITFVDSDDTIASNCYESCIRHITDDVDVVAFSLSEVFSTGTRKVQTIPFEGKMHFADGMFSRALWNVTSKVFRASTLRKYDMAFREGFIYEDMEFCARFFLASSPIVYYINEPFYDYWQNSGSIMSNTKTQKEGQSIQHIYQLDSVHAFLKKHDALESSLGDFLSLCKYCFTSAYHYAPAHEKAKCYAEMTARLRAWDLDYSGHLLLSCLCHGDYLIQFNQDVYYEEKRLKGMEHIFCVRTEGDYKVVRVFGRRVLWIRKRR